MKIVGRDLHMRYQQVAMLDGASALHLAVFRGVGGWRVALPMQLL